MLLVSRNNLLVCDIELNSVMREEKVAGNRSKNMCIEAHGRRSARSSTEEHQVLPSKVQANEEQEITKNVIRAPHDGLGLLFEQVLDVKNACSTLCSQT